MLSLCYWDGVHTIHHVAGFVLYLWHHTKGLFTPMTATKSHENLWCNIIIKLTADDDSETGWQINQMYCNQTTGNKEEGLFWTSKRKIQ